MFVHAIMPGHASMPKNIWDLGSVCSLLTVFNNTANRLGGGNESLSVWTAVNRLNVFQTATGAVGVNVH